MVMLQNVNVSVCLYINVGVYGVFEQWREGGMEGRDSCLPYCLVLTSHSAHTVHTYNNCDSHYQSHTHTYP